jgi:hypothetical protein
LELQLPEDPAGASYFDLLFSQGPLLECGSQAHTPEPEDTDHIFAERASGDRILSSPCCCGWGQTLHVVADERSFACGSLPGVCDWHNPRNANRSGKRNFADF